MAPVDEPSSPQESRILGRRIASRLHIRTAIPKPNAECARGRCGPDPGGRKGLPARRPHTERRPAFCQRECKADMREVVLTVNTDQQTAKRMKILDERNSRKTGFFPRRGLTRLRTSLTRLIVMVPSRKLSSLSTKGNQLPQQCCEGYGAESIVVDSVKKSS